MIYLLTPNDRAYIVRIANVRTHSHRYSRNGFGNYHGDSDIVGMYGEYAFAKLFSYPLPGGDLIRGDQGIDFENSLFRIQVKTTRYKTGKLLFDHRRPFIAEIAVLAIASNESEQVYLAGWLDRASFLSLATVPSWGRYGGELVVSQDNLISHSWHLLMAEEKLLNAG